MVAVSDRIKPLPFRGGVGVGAIFKAQRQTESPHPAATKQQAAKSHCPSPEGEGKSAPIKTEILL
jgi:hypothetical protein